MNFYLYKIVRLTFVWFSLVSCCVTLLVVGLAHSSVAAAADMTSSAVSIERKLDKSPNLKSEQTVVFIGDSIAAGYGVKKEEAFPDRVGAILKEKGYAVKIINGGISGSVSAEADRRVKWFLRAKPQIVVLELGGNDGLKGTPIEVIKANLKKAIDLAKENNVRVVLCGMKIYANFGADYTAAFEKMYKDLAHEEKVFYVPFLLEGVALKRELNQSDMKHPNPRGHEIVAQTVAHEVEKAL